MRVVYFFCSIAAVSITLYSCLFETDLQKGERLAKTHCGSCHLFPEPSLLDKNTWENGVMPKMAFRMGLDNFQLLEIPGADQNAVASVIPASAIISEKEWALIKSYYQATAPDALTNAAIQFDSLLSQFECETIKLGRNNVMVTLLQANEKNKSLWVGTRQSKLYKLDYQFHIQDTIQLSSPPSQLLFDENSLGILQMGIMDPNDQPAGSFVRLEDDEKIIRVIDSLKRPVFIEPADLDNDNKVDYIVCAFGNFTGALLAYENNGSGSYVRHAIANSPGSRKVVVEDVDDDGDPDIMALLTQGDEKIILFLNEGDFVFKPITLLVFPPVYGSNYFELADFNGDGLKDIVYTNGDNADYSFTIKPYHGVRIFLNREGFKFEPSFFFPLPGASQTSVYDFDDDGDLDIAAIAFFPNFAAGQNGFVYLENIDNSTQFKPYTTSLATDARWLRMEMADMNDDRQMDLILGALNFPIGATVEARNYWSERNISLLVLYNRGARVDD